MLRNLVNPVGLQTIRGQIDVSNTVIADKQVDDFRQFPAQGRLAAAEPQIGERRCALRELDDLIPREIALLVQLVPVKARFACRVAMRRDKKDKRIQLSLAADSPNTWVSLGDTSL